ncbi:MAG: DUF4262 domain-containing protein [Acidobacteria bacterium]|nr:DUF4262 domain-containing protein [Acidobacteriota bacterium]MBV9186837.1 DUF4262 domain-containing protein [Acidobacteriota bacterium]
MGVFATFGHPEIVVVGLFGDRAHAFINNIVDDIKDGAKFEAGCRYDHLIDGYEVAFIAVEPTFYGDYFGRDIDFYGSRSCPMIQMLWPDRNQSFPWQPECEPEIRKLQPVLVSPRSSCLQPT